MLTRSLFTHCISQNNELGSFAVLEIKLIQWIRLDDYVRTICQLAIYIWKGSLVIFRPNHCEFPPIDYELAASIKLGNLGQLNLPEPPSFVWLMVSHMLFAPIMCDIWLEFFMAFACLVCWLSFCMLLTSIPKISTMIASQPNQTPSEMICAHQSTLAISRCNALNDHISSTFWEYSLVI